MSALVVATLLLTGCASSPARTPRIAPPSASDVTVVIFNDSFHSGFLLPNQPDLAFLDPQPAGEPATRPWIEVGFGADAWVVARDPGACTAVWLAFSRTAGVLMLEHRVSDLRPPRDPDTPVRFWRIRLSQESWTRLVAELHTWVVEEVVQPRQPDEAAFMRFSARRWSSFRNCHDFVVETLDPVGLDLAWRAVYTSDGFSAVMDGAQRELDPIDEHALLPPAP